MLWPVYQYLDSSVGVWTPNCLFSLSWTNEASLSILQPSANPSLFEDGGVEKLFLPTLPSITLSLVWACERRYVLCLTGEFVGGFLDFFIHTLVYLCSSCCLKSVKTLMSNWLFGSEDCRFCVGA